MGSDSHFKASSYDGEVIFEKPVLVRLQSQTTYYIAYSGVTMLKLSSQP